MNKQKWSFLCYTASALAVVGFGATVVWDWHRYNTTLNSAPFRVFVLVDAICFLMPALVLLILGRWLRKRK